MQEILHNNGSHDSEGGEGGGREGGRRGQKREVRLFFKISNDKNGTAVGELTSIIISAKQRGFLIFYCVEKSTVADFKLIFNNSRLCSLYTVKKVSDFPVPGRDVTNQTLPGQEYFR